MVVLIENVANDLMGLANNLRRTMGDSKKDDIKKEENKAGIKEDGEPTQIEGKTTEKSESSTEEPSEEPTDVKKEVQENG